MLWTRYLASENVQCKQPQQFTPYGRYTRKYIVYGQQAQTYKTDSSHVLSGRKKNMSDGTDDKKDVSEAILGQPKQRSPNRLIVDEASNDDNSVIALSPAKC